MAPPLTEESSEVSDEGRELLRSGGGGGGGCCVSLGASLGLAVSYNARSLARDKRSFFIGVSTVALVVTFSAVLMSAIVASPIIFLKLAEDGAGEADMVLTAEGGGLPTLNFTALAAMMAANPSVSGVAPRWPTLASAVNHNTRQATLSAVFWLDSDLEASIGLGRSWGRRALGERECYAASSLMLELGLRGGRGDLLDVVVDLPMLLQTLASAGGGGGGGSGNNTDAQAQATAAALVRSLLAAAGVDLSSVDLSVDALTALQVALAAAGLGDAGFNASAAAALFPGLAQVRVDLSPLLAQALARAAGALSLSATYTVLDEFASPGGKFASVLGNAVVLEAAYLPVLLRQAVGGALAQVAAVLAPLAQVAGGGAGQLLAAVQQLQRSLPSLDYAALRQFAPEVEVVAAARLPALYMRGSADAINAGVAAFAAGVVASSLGPAAAVAVATPLAGGLAGLQFIALFLNQIFYVTTVVLALLGATVVYALVLGDVGARTFELGLLQALGMRHATLGQLLALQTAAFALPGLAAGGLAASLANLGLAAFVRWFASLAPADWPDALGGAAWGYAAALGLVVPLLAVVAPIRRALTGTLRDALDVSHQAVSEVTVRVLKLAEAGVSPAQTALALMLAGTGVVTFYVLPLAFLVRDFAGFLGTLTAILLGMLVGLSVLAQVAQPAAEAAVLRALLAAGGDARRLHTVVARNLDGHRPRNALTSYLVSITVGFLIFAAVMFDLQAAAISTNVKMFLGADVVALVLTTAAGGGSAVTVGTGGNVTASLALPQGAMGGFLDGLRARDAASPRGDASATVAGYTFVSLPLPSLPIVRRTALSNLLGVPATQNRLYGVQANYLQVAYSEFALVTQVSAQGLDHAAETTGGGAIIGAPLPPASASASALGAWAAANPVAALYAGAGGLALPIEAALQQRAPPPPLATQPGGGAAGLPAAGFVCAAPTAGAAGTFLYTIDAAATGQSSALAFATYGGQVLTTDAGDGSSGGRPVVGGSMPWQAVYPLAGSSDAPPSPFTYGLAAAAARDFAATAPAGGSATGSVFADYQLCAAACSDALVFDFRARAPAGGNGTAANASSASTTAPLPSASNGDWRWSAPAAAPGAYGQACAAANSSGAAAALANYSAATALAALALNDAAVPATAGAFQFGLLPGATALRLAANAAAAAGTASSGAAAGPAAWAQQLLVNASGCALPVGCVAVSTASPYAAADRISGAYLSYVDVLMSEAMRPGAAVSTGSPMALRLATRDPASGWWVQRPYLAKARAALRKLPGFVLSSYGVSAARSPVLARMADAERLRGDALADYAAVRDFMRDRATGAAAAAATPAPGAPPPPGGGGGSAAAAPAAPPLRLQSFPPVPAWVPSRPQWLLQVAPNVSAAVANASASWQAEPAAAVWSGGSSRGGGAGAAWIAPIAWVRQAAAAPAAAAAAAGAYRALLLGGLLAPAPPALLPGALFPSLATALPAAWAAAASPLAPLSLCATAGSSSSGGGVGCALAGGVLQALPPALQAALMQPQPPSAAAAAAAASSSVVHTLDLGACGFVTGMQVTTNASAALQQLRTAASFAPAAVDSAAQYLILSLFALSDPSAVGVELVATAVVPVAPALLFPGQQPVDWPTSLSLLPLLQQRVAFAGFSARYWAVVVTPVLQVGSGDPSAAALLLPQLSFSVGRVATASGACRGDALGSSDAVPSLPKHRLMVRLAPGVSADDRQRVINGLRATVRTPLIQVQDTLSLLAAADTAVWSLNAFFVFVAAIALTLAFFSTWLSFAANVAENSVEFGILRSLGLTSAAVTRAFVYEALTVVLTSFLLGTAIGTAVAVTLTLQFNLFTEQPFAMRFPAALFCFTLLGCAVLAVAASWLPARGIARMPIAGVLKGRSAS